MKLIAFYLPQFHEIEENNQWWGKGYTEWTAVKNAKPLFKGHREPRVPLNNYYYDLSDESAEAWKWQAALAKQYGLYGFCIYHYWFEGKQLLQKPMEILRDHPEIDIRYCICWANETWSRNWYGQERTVLMEQTYGDESAWKQHFEYLFSFFSDDRYIKINNKPVLNIYQSKNIEDLSNMLKVWNKLAVNKGFDGIYLVSAITAKGEDSRNGLFDAKYIFEPGYTLKQNLGLFNKASYLTSTLLKRMSNKYFRTKFVEHLIDIKSIYKNIEKKTLREGIFPGTFPQWDNTPRTSFDGLSYLNSSPELFEQHLSYLLKKYKDREFLYINAWNEWGEGAYLEPDEDYQYAYLDAIKNALKNSNI